MMNMNCEAFPLCGSSYKHAYMAAVYYVHRYVNVYTAAVMYIQTHSRYVQMYTTDMHMYTSKELLHTLSCDPSKRKSVLHVSIACMHC